MLSVGETQQLLTSHRNGVVWDLKGSKDGWEMISKSKVFVSSWTLKERLLIRHVGFIRSKIKLTLYASLERVDSEIGCGSPRARAPCIESSEPFYTPTENANEKCVSLKVSEVGIARSEKRVEGLVSFFFESIFTSANPIKVTLVAIIMRGIWPRVSHLSCDQRQRRNEKLGFRCDEMFSH